MASPRTDNRPERRSGGRAGLSATCWDEPLKRAGQAGVFAYVASLTYAQLGARWAELEEADDTRGLLAQAIRFRLEGMAAERAVTPEPEDEDDSAEEEA